MYEVTSMRLPALKRLLQQRCRPLPYNVDPNTIIRLKGRPFQWEATFEDRTNRIIENFSVDTDWNDLPMTDKSGPHMPATSCFVNEAVYIHVLLHEISHFNGLSNGRYSFIKAIGLDLLEDFKGSKEQMCWYYKEEMVAETSALFLLHDMGIERHSVRIAGHEFTMRELAIYYLKGYLSMLLYYGEDQEKCLDWILNEAYKTYSQVREKIYS